MIAPIETRGDPVYGARMRSLLLRLLAFFAVVLAPLGMAAAPAAPMQHQHMVMPTQHCPEQDSSRHSRGALSACTMACASALPAVDLGIAAVHALLKFTPQPALVAKLSGIELEIATPPPRLS